MYPKTINNGISTNKSNSPFTNSLNAQSNIKALASKSNITKLKESVIQHENSLDIGQMSARMLIKKLQEGSLKTQEGFEPKVRSDFEENKTVN